jgi:hypothetical protein
LQLICLGERALGLSDETLPVGRQKLRGRSDFEYRPRAIFRTPMVILTTPMVILTRRRAMRIFRLANIRQRRGYGGNSDASVLAIEIGLPTDRVRGFGPVRA